MFCLCLGPGRVCWVLHQCGGYGGPPGPAAGERGYVEAVLYGRQYLFHCIPCVLPLISVVIQSLLDLWRLGGAAGGIWCGGSPLLLRGSLFLLSG